MISRESIDLFGEIIIVVNGISADPDILLVDCLPFQKQSSNLSFVCVKDVLHPGQARNLGVSYVKTDYVSFLDVRTLPSRFWFESLSDFVQNQEQGLKLGFVEYAPTSYFSEVFIASTYGFLPLRCLPGSIASIDTFSRVGNFISARSGEDSEWIMRARLIGVPISFSRQIPQLEYRFNFSGKKVFTFLRKWFRNYSVSFRLPGYQVHKYLYTFLGSSLLLMLFSIWNWRIAGWNESSPLYLPYVTRFALIVLVVFYISFRAIYLPIAKGVLKRDRPLLLLLCSFPFAVMFDLVKILAGFQAVLHSLFSRLRHCIYLNH